VIPNFLAIHEDLIQEKWKEDVLLSTVVADIYENINDFHKSEVQRLLSPKKSS
jgi:hypothetical protein